MTSKLHSKKTAEQLRSASLHFTARHATHISDQVTEHEA